MALINCPKCGKSISNTSKACIHCGCGLEICPECGSALSCDTHKCPNCGYVMVQKEEPQKIESENNSKKNEKLPLNQAIAFVQKNNSIFKAIKIWEPIIEILLVIPLMLIPIIAMVLLLLQSSESTFLRAFNDPSLINFADLLQSPEALLFAVLFIPFFSFIIFINIVLPDLKNLLLRKAVNKIGYDIVATHKYFSSVAEYRFTSPDSRNCWFVYMLDNEKDIARNTIILHIAQLIAFPLLFPVSIVIQMINGNILSYMIQGDFGGIVRLFIFLLTFVILVLLLAVPSGIITSYINKKRDAIISQWKK